MNKIFRIAEKVMVLCWTIAAVQCYHDKMRWPCVAVPFVAAIIFGMVADNCKPGKDA